METNNEIFEVPTNETDPTPEAPVEAVPEVEVPVVEAPAVEVPQQTWQAAEPVPPPVGGEQKSKLVAGLLQLFLGMFGAGRFYLGYTGMAIGQIAASWLTCGVGALWPVIDGIMILTGSVKTDAKGIPLRD